jgi:hypothetical protein
MEKALNPTNVFLSIIILLEFVKLRAPPDEVVRVPSIKYPNDGLLTIPMLKLSQQMRK